MQFEFRQYLSMLHNYGFDRKDIEDTISSTFGEYIGFSKFSIFWRNLNIVNKHGIENGFKKLKVKLNFT